MLDATDGIIDDVHRLATGRAPVEFTKPGFSDRHDGANPDDKVLLAR